MALGDFLNRLGAAFVMRENAKNGNTAAAQAAQAASEGSLLRRAQLAQIVQRLQLAPKMQEAQINQMNAHANLYNTPKTALKVVNGDLWDMTDAASPRKVIAGASNPGYTMQVDQDQNVVFIPKPGTGGPRSSAVAPPVSANSGQPNIPDTTSPSPVASPAAVAPTGQQGGGVIATGVKKRAPAPKAPHLVAGTDATTGNPTWGVAGGPGFLPPLTQVERTRRDQASHVISQGAALIAELNKPEVQKIMGPRAGLKTAFEDTRLGGFITGGAPPEASHLASSLSSLSAFLPIMHGMRGGDNMIQHFEKQMGKQGELAIYRPPEAVQAAVSALVEAARRIRERGDSADLTDLVPILGTPAGPGAPGGGGFRVVGVRPAQ
jgi:hypothetical protein